MGWLLALWLAAVAHPPAASRLPAGARFVGDGAAITASLYSLPSSFVDAGTAASFLTAVRALAARRTLLVLADPPARAALAEPAKRLGVRLLDAGGRAYTPWVRDPLSFFWTAKGRLFVLTRPNRQPGREDDFYLGRQLVQSLPADLDRAWGGVRWGEAQLPFHNGQILPTERAVWISLHSLEPRILALLGVDRVPVETFGTAAGIDRYAAAAERAAAELGALYGRPARFVHPLPDAGFLPGRIAQMRTIGGGAGYDLDSYLTLLPGPGAGRALVADLEGGKRLLAATPVADLESLRQGYGLSPPAEALRGELAAALATPAAASLEAYLDGIAEHLKAQGLAVSRLPLLIVPVRLLADAEGVANADFWITWNNVVAETRNRQVRAEGFASLLPAGDEKARATFAAAGCHLDLVPPLVKSVILTGGYRCASNHVRERRGR